jgi:hypothetical protein
MDGFAVTPWHLVSFITPCLAIGLLANLSGGAWFSLSFSELVEAHKGRQGYFIII